MVKTAKLAEVDTYKDLCEYYFGKEGFYLVSVSMFFFDFGAMLVYLIILGDSSEKLALAWFGLSGVYVRRWLIISVSSILIFPLCILKDISMLEKVSAFSVLTVLLLSIIIVYKYFAIGEKYEDLPITYVSMGFPAAFGTIVFAFVCQDFALMTFKSLARPTTKRLGLLIHLACAISCLILLAFATGGYLTFRGAVSSNVLNGYSADDTLVQIANLMYVVTMALTYPISFFVTRNATHAMIFRGSKRRKSFSLKIRLAISIPLFLASLAIVLVVTDLGIVMSITGSITAVFIAFVLPSACYLKAQPAPLKFWLHKRGVWKGFKRVGPSMVLIFFGICVMIFSTAQNIANQ